MLLNTDAIVASLPASLDATQRESARVIVDEFWRAGWPPSYALAAVANAYAESALYPNAVGDIQTSNGSVGLFQLLKDGARGAAGHLTNIQAPRPIRAGTRDGQPAPGDVRADPRTNTELILAEVQRYNTRRPGPSSMPSLADAHAASDVGTVTSSFAGHIERPANAIAKGAHRAGIARAWWPQWTGSTLAATLQWSSPAPPPSSSGTGRALAWIAGAVLVVLVLLAVAAMVASKGAPRMSLRVAR